MFNKISRKTHTSIMYQKLFLLVLSFVCGASSDPVLVHAVFRHGHRTPQSGSLYPNDPYYTYSFYPYGFGQLTNKGKNREYELGQFLRRRYNDFLGDIYTTDIMDVRSTGMNRTKMSLELVLAGLFPPKGIQAWNSDLGEIWQPIPYNYLDLDKDKTLMSIYANPDYLNYRDNVFLKSQSNLFTGHEDLYNYLSQHSGKTVTDFFGVQEIYDVLKTEDEYGLILPEWTQTVYPDKLLPLSGRAFALNAGDLQLKQMSSGALLEKIVMDTLKKLNGNPDRQTRKLFLYSAHDFNVAVLLTTLGVYDNIPPPYGSCVIIEVHEIDAAYGIKIFYHNWTGSEPMLLKLPECEEFCPFEQFVTIVEKYFPVN